MLLRQRDFRLLWVGQGISEIGSAVTTVALPLLAVTDLHATPAQVGLVTAASMAAWLVLALPLGAWADRRRRRPLLVAADLGRAALLATIPLAAAAGVLGIAQLGVVALLVGALNVMFDVAYPAYLPSVIPADRLVDGNGQLSATDAGANVGGPGLGGVLIQAFGSAVTLLADVLSFVASAVTLLLIRAKEPAPPPPPAEGRRLRTELLAGLRLVFSRRFTRALMLGGAIGNFTLGGASAVTVVFLYRQIGLRGAAIGGLLAVGAIGAVLGSLLAGPAARRFGDARVIWVAPLTGGVLAQLVAVTRPGAGLVLFAVGTLGLSAGVAMFSVCVRAAIQATVPSHLLARVGASIRLFSRGAWPIGAVTAGTLAGATSARTALAAVLAGFLLCPVSLWFSPVGRVRTIEELSAEADKVPV